MPRLSAAQATLEDFLDLFTKFQLLYVRAEGGRRRKPVVLKAIRTVYKEHPKMVQKTFCVEASDGSADLGEKPVEVLLRPTRVPPGSWYSSFIIQRNRKALGDFLKGTLPRGAPDFLQPCKGTAKAPVHSNALWVFFGRNPATRPLCGRPEHTDAIAHSGTWHVQLAGSKVWHVRPTAELSRKVPALRGAGPFRIHCKLGDVLCINTRLWWHHTHIPGKSSFSLSIARDMYLDGRSSAACNMTNVDGHYALKTIPAGAVIFTEEEAPRLELPRSSSASANCGLRELQGRMVVVAKRRIRQGEWFSLSDSEAED